MSEKSITIRVENDLHYSVKMYATKQGKTLQEYIIEVLTDDLNRNGEMQKSPKKP
jgi:predicted HicB family RNase H-like nuclease